MPALYGTYKQREELKSTVDQDEANWEDPYRRRGIVRPEDFKRKLDSEKANLAKVTPPELTSSKEKAELSKQLKALEEAMVLGNASKGIPPMPTIRQMEDNPVGSTGHHMRWEKYWKTHTLDSRGFPVKVRYGERGGVYEWKDGRRQLYPEREAEDNDLANIEILRRDSPNAVPLADDKVPRSYGFSAQGKENYDATFPDHEPTSVEQKVADAKPSFTWKVCQATNKKGLICGRKVIAPNKPYCFSKWHRNQFEKVSVTPIEVDKTPVVEKSAATEELVDPGG